MSDNLYRLLEPSAETNLAEAYARIVDHIGRLTGAVEDGNLRYAWEKAGELRTHLEEFERRLQKQVHDGDETYYQFTGGHLDGQKVAEASVAFAIAFGHRAGKMLHSVDQIKDEAVRAEVIAADARNRSFRDGVGF